MLLYKRKYPHWRASKEIVLAVTIFLFVATNYAIIYAADLTSELTLEKLVVTADKMFADKKANFVRFEGNVVVDQKDFTLYSKELSIHYLDGKELKEIIAVGDVKIVQGRRIATGDKAIYKRLDRSIVLTGNPRIKQDKDMVSGYRITIYLDQEKSIIEGKEDMRVNAVIYPKKEGAEDKK